MDKTAIINVIQNAKNIAIIRKRYITAIFSDFIYIY